MAKRAGEARDLIVVGAGAAGLWAAARAAEHGRHVLLVEKTPRTGTKVLASGGTRCNLTTALDAGAAARAFGRRGERFLRHAFRLLPPGQVRERFHALGVATVEEKLDKVFPASGRARDVRDALEGWAHAAGVTIRCDAPVASVEPHAAGWCVRLADGEALVARSLFLCPGGQSYPRSGTTGDGYRWLRALGLPVVEPVPALVPLTSPARWVHALAGVDLPEASVRLLDAQGRVVAERARPLLFTHRGLSGPAAMDVSEPVARAPHAGWQLRIDLAPGRDREALRERLLAHGDRTPLASLLARGLGVPLPRRLVRALLDALGIPAQASLPAHQLPRTERHALVEALKGLAIEIDGTLGFERAEVTAGGLALDAVDPHSMRVRDRHELYVFGELLDLTGPIGGFHFQSAFACAELAARAAGSGS